ncbi:MAG: hypothetical protein APF81_06325 [Desulfosporosinus sp. BRH_c37]|nr:MAG: hypothetical protein APF81_06325 [Desulfosporosinus sp. BRH_c37]
MDKKRIVTLAGTLVLAGAVVAAGVYGPSVWKVFRQQSAITDSVVIQSPTVDSSGANAINGANGISNGTAPIGTSGVVQSAATPANTITAPPQGDTGSKSKYREPDSKLLDLAPSVATFFSETALSNDAKSLAFGTAWNIHQYVDGYLFGPAAGPQMNDLDIKKYIVFHKTLLDKQLKNEANVSKAVTFTSYLDVLLNSGIDAFDSKDKTRIEQFHQGIHDLDTHIMRNDLSSKIYGATPFATKRT